MSIRTITCTNSHNFSLTFGDKLNPYLLENCDGLYEVDANVTVTQNGMTDGGTYIGTTIKPRNIVITLRFKEELAVNRNQLYQLFKPGYVGTLTYEEIDGNYEEVRLIDYYVEKLTSDGAKRARTATISLISADPFFRDRFPTTVEMTTWENKFEFAHEFLAAKEELASLKKEKLVNIVMENTIAYIGVTINMVAEGDIINPKMTHVESGTYIQVGYDENDIEGFEFEIDEVELKLSKSNIHLDVKYDEEDEVYLCVYHFRLKHSLAWYLMNRLDHEIAMIDRQIEKKSGLLKVCDSEDHFDKAIIIIRESNCLLTARNELMKKFQLSEIQAEYILSVTLRELASTTMDNVLRDLDFYAIVKSLLIDLKE